MKNLEKKNQKSEKYAINIEMTRCNMNILKYCLEMTIKKNVGKAARLLRPIVVCCLLLTLFATQAIAQGNDKMVVIKRNISPTLAGNTDDHYLAHVKVNGEWVLQDATVFSPNCVWYTGANYNRAGTNHNFYFIDDTETPRFLSAPMSSNGALSLSASLPPTYMLSNTDLNYYFYDWDKKGIARGHQVSGVIDAGNCSFDFEDGECWEVYWVEYDLSSSQWKLTNDHSYGIIGNSARAYDVTATKHDIVINGDPTGGLTALSVPNSDMTFVASPLASQTPSVTVSNYVYNHIPAYTTYTFNEITNESGTTETRTHNYYGDADHGTDVPAAQDANSEPTAYEWTLTGPGAEFLSFAENADETTSTSTTPPTIYYRTENTNGHKTATLTLTITFGTGASAATMTRTVDINVKTTCQNPAQAAAPQISYEGVTLTWNATANKYKVEWKKTSDDDWATASVAEVEGSNSYFIPESALTSEAEYVYRVTAWCNDAYLSTPLSPTGSFTAKTTSGVLIYGAVFGGGRMADVNGKTEVVIINCDTLSAVYGGNDIAGSVVGNDGSTITLGVNAGDTYSTEYNESAASTRVNIGSVYGGGNGYYAYNGTSFVEATETTTTIPASGEIKTMTRSNSVGSTAWTNGASPYVLTIPSIKKTAVTVTNDAVKVDSIFGGAKNAFISNTSGDNTLVTINGGTIFSVFGGNNFGGTLGAGSNQHIELASTKTNLTYSDVNTYTTGFGRDFGVRYLFGGGNKVAGRNVIINVTGGQTDTIFGGGNRADVGNVNITVNCVPAAGSGSTFGNIYSNAIESFTDKVNVKSAGYDWNGTGIYNVRTLFGGNNAATMAGLPTITLQQGSVGTVYGGGNAGDMFAKTTDGTIATDFGSPIVDGITKDIYYGTHVIMNSANMLVDYLYGGCQKSNVLYSTWVEVQNGHVGTVYGGCNISGDVGSNYNIPYSSGMPKDRYQYVYGATYVKASGGTIHGNLFAGSNGYYHCNDGTVYVNGIDYDDPEHYYIGLNIPTHNETNVNVTGNVNINGNVYAGGNMAPVGFIVEGPEYEHRAFVGMATIRMSGGTVHGSVYGGGNMASIYGSNEVLVSGGTINGALYGGNDRAGQVAQISNRVLPAGSDLASDGKTSLDALNVHTYVEVTGRPDINIIYGGGNGDYIYTPAEYCDITDQPIQTNTFVDINIDGYPTGGGTEDGGHINTVYGGGNGVTVTGGINVMLNVKGEGGGAPVAYDHVNVIYGGNNKGDLAIVPDIIMLNGQVNTVYGGCNQGAMTGSTTIRCSGNDYTNTGSFVNLRNKYKGVGATGDSVTTNATVNNAVYGGCRMNGVTNNSLVVVEGGTHTNATIYGGSDISGTIGNTSHVVMTGGTVKDIYGGGNGNYDYTAGTYMGLTAPISTTSMVDIMSGTVGNSGDPTADVVFGGGLGANTNTTGNVTVNIGPATGTAGPDIYGSVYGGSALGSVNTNTDNTTTVNILNGHVYNSVFGGGLGDTTYALVGGTTNLAAVVKGNAIVNIGNAEQASNGVVIDGYVFGGNNNNGSPAGTVDVNIYRTGHNANNTVPNVELTVNDIPTTWPLADASTDPGSSDSYYALKGVYGGGNLAHKASTTQTTVHVYNCDNSIKYVYGGAKAANLAGSAAVTIDGGHIYQVFGGGDGADVHDLNGTPNNAYANIAGNTNTTINGGYMHYVFGGSNTRGTIGGTQNVTVSELSGPEACFTPIIDNFFAGGNLAASTGDINTLIENCNVKFGNFYGGANQASITGNVTTTIKGGTYRQIFGGSKSADITGNVTVNFNGGTVGNLFGGNNTSGEISGTIVVNVEKNSECGFSIDYVYGGGRDAAYGDGGHNHGNYPQVNIIHTGANTATEKVVYDVFGGGLGTGAQVYGNPQVNIGDGVGGHTVTVGRNVFGGGSAAQVNGNTAVKVLGTTTSVGSNVYGGGNEATVTGNTDVQIGD